MQDAECFCPEELGGACYFEPVTPELSDWMPTVEHYPLSKRGGGKETVDNVLLAHRLCNRIDYSIVTAVPTQAISRGLGRPVRTRSAATTKDRTP
jgi:hypothetical protein